MKKETTTTTNKTPNTSITIEMSEYIELLQKAERLSVIERIIEETNYISTDQIKAIISTGKEIGKK